MIISLFLWYPNPYPQNCSNAPIALNLKVPYYSLERVIWPSILSRHSSATCSRDVEYYGQISSPSSSLSCCQEWLIIGVCQGWDGLGMLQSRPLSGRRRPQAPSGGISGVSPAKTAAASSRKREPARGSSLTNCYSYKIGDGMAGYSFYIYIFLKNAAALIYMLYDTL